MDRKRQEVRDSSFELLRIISMISIVISHFATHGGFHFDAQTLSIPRFWWYFIEMGGYFGVNVFVLISGYFLINDRSGLFNYKRILKFWGQVVFYSLAIYVIFVLAGVSEFSWKEMIGTLCPITTNRWWFASTYFELYLLHPFLNMFLRRMDRGIFQKFLVLLIIMWCIVPTLAPEDYLVNPLVWFVTLYSVAAYIRLYGLNPRFKCRHYLCFCIVFSLLRYLSSVTLILLGTKVPIASRRYVEFYERWSVLTFLSALSMFMVFYSIKMGYNKWINVIASATFGVYLIHDNRIVRPFLWQTVFKNASYQDSALIIPYSIAVMLLVYSVCTIIDLIRKATVEKAYVAAVDTYADTWVRPFEAVIGAVKRFVFGNV